MRRGILLAIGLATTAASQNSGLSPDVLLLSRLMRHVRQAVTAVPNYTCSETVYREQMTVPAKDFSRSIWSNLRSQNREARKSSPGRERENSMKNQSPISSATKD